MIKSFACYDTLSTEDVEVFEKGLIQWATLAKGKKAIMLFDLDTLNPIYEKLVENPAVSSKYEHELFLGYHNSKLVNRNHLFTPNLQINWSHVAFSEQKCVLRSITDKNKKVIYEAPEKWADCELWYGY